MVRAKRQTKNEVFDLFIQPVEGDVGSLVDCQGPGVKHAHVMGTYTIESLCSFTYPNTGRTQRSKRRRCR